MHCQRRGGRVTEIAVTGVAEIVQAIPRSYICIRVTVLHIEVLRSRDLFSLPPLRLFVFFTVKLGMSPEREKRSERERVLGGTPVTGTAGEKVRGRRKHKNEGSHVRGNCITGAAHVAGGGGGALTRGALSLSGSIQRE